MKYVYLTLNWVFGVVFFLTGLLSLVESPLGGLCLIVISLLLLPPIRNFIYSKTNKEFPFKARAATIFALLVAFGVFVGQIQDKKEQEIAAAQAQEKAEQDAKLRQENIDYFNLNKKEILTKIGSALAEKDYQSVVLQSAKFLVSGDDELLRMNETAKIAIAEVQKSEKTEAILAKLKSVPSSEFEQNRTLYQQLLNMHPSNTQYKEKFAYYTDKIKEEEQTKFAAEAKKKKIEQQFSAWDGSHNNLERVIKKSMNDPDSYEHDETVYWDMGDHLVVQTIYRGKNAFGGVVKNFVKAKVSLEGEILQILDQT